VCLLAAQQQHADLGLQHLQPASQPASQTARGKQRRAGGQEGSQQRRLGDRGLKTRQAQTVQAPLTRIGLPR
jgi:hypothetical protein